MTRIDLVAAAVFAAGCSSSAVADFVPDVPAPASEQQGYVAYGGSGYLSYEQELTMQHLAWPQTYSAMKGTFGFPNRRTEAADIYKLGDSSEVWVYYQGTRATGYAVR